MLRAHRGGGVAGLHPLHRGGAVRPGGHPGGGAAPHRAPLTLFLLCGIFPLVPGAGIYYTAYYLLTNQETLFAAKGVETLKIAVALALGIAIVCSIPLPGRWSRRQYRGPKPN